MNRQSFTLFLATVISLATAAPAAANTPFESGGGLYYSSAAGPSAVDTADFNRDGFMDVVLADIETDLIRVRFGGTASVLTLASGFVEACYVRVGDVNGDGWVDVVGSLRGAASDKVNWWRNPGAAGGAWTEFPVATGVYFTEARSVAVGDLDSDGDVDVVIAGMAGAGSFISWAENSDGAGTVWTIRDITVGSTSGFGGPHDVVIADFNEDGYQDVAAVAYDSDKVAWFYNDGYILDGDTWYMYTVATGINGALCLSAVDYDSDGDMDILAGAYLADDVLWFENRIEAALPWVNHTIDADLDGVYTVRAADLDLDGDLDVLASGRNADDVRWYEHTASGHVQHVIDASFDGARSAVAEDFDGDGDLDVVAAGQFAHSVWWWENRTIHSTAAFADRVTVGNGILNPETVKIADLDQDGELEIVGTATNSTSLSADVMVWDKIAGTWTGTAVDSELSSAHSVAVADIDGDHDMDLVVAAAGSGNGVFWYRGNYAGSFGTRQTVATGISGWDVGVADFNCDGAPDIAVADTVSGNVMWFENDGVGGYSWTQHTVPGFDGAGSMDIADMDLDGNPDLVVADYSLNVLWVLPHFGCGTVWGQSTIAQAFAGPRDVTVADFNGDGWPDVVASANNADTLAVFLNDPAEAWTWDRYDVDTGFDFWGVAAADINSDGATDVVATCRDDGDVRWFRNNGNGTTWYTNDALDTTLLGANGVAVGDIDSDGRPDVVAAGTILDTVALYEGDGGQYRMWFHQDLAPAAMGDSETAAILKLYPLHAGISGDLDMELRNLRLRFVDGAGTPLTSAQANALISNVQVRYDSNGNGSFDPASDAVVAAVGPLDLDINGNTTVAVGHGGSNPRIEFGYFYQFFVVVMTTADASSQVPNQFRITHYESGPTMASYYDHPTIELRPMAWEAYTSSAVTCLPAGLIFSDDFETGTVSRWSQTVGN